MRIQAGDSLLVTVADDGDGLPAAPRRDGVGLVSMRQRARELGGTLTINGAYGRGTTVELRIPLAGAAVAS